MKALIERGIPYAEAEAKLQAGDRYVHAFSYGICLSGGSQADFVPARYKCHRWAGKGGLRTEGKQDDLVEEIKDKLGDPT